MKEDGLSSFQLFLCGLAAGTCAKLVCHPLDVVKKRFQVALPLLTDIFNTFLLKNLIVNTKNIVPVPFVHFEVLVLASSDQNIKANLCC